MNKPTENLFMSRPTVTLELPLAANTRILHPEQVILKIGQNYIDVGAFCYALRSDKKRKPRQAREVVLTSLLKQRPKQVAQLIKALSGLMTGQRQRTVGGYAHLFRLFIDWADANGLHDCLAGGNAIQRAYRTWANAAAERYRRSEIVTTTYNMLLNIPRILLESMTGITDLGRGVHKVKQEWNPKGGTEPAAAHDFAHALALNQALFDGLCDLVLNQKPFPFQLDLPGSLGWKDNFLWLFPTHLWRLPPHVWGAEREKLDRPCWAYNYERGRLATPEEITHRYPGAPYDQRDIARYCVRSAAALLDAANREPCHRHRLKLGMIALNAFVVLLLANTGCNESVAREIETDGEIDASTLNQRYRSIKFRAQGKMIPLIVPASFMPTLRRYMELRRYLLNSCAFPYLVFSFGSHKTTPPTQMAHDRFGSIYRVLRGIDPLLPMMGSRKLRATVKDHYHRTHDAAITAKIMGTTEETEMRSYTAGSSIDHHEELTLFLNKVAGVAKKQKVQTEGTTVADAKPLEEGGRCDHYGHPEAMADGLPVVPDCKQGQGCIFCTHRVLIAGEEDARKVASAAFVMEQVILGPLHEAELRPLIRKCDDDLEKIASFQGCRPMVERVKKDVYRNGNLTPYFADKYHLFLELGVIV